MKTHKDAHRRSIAKAISWRVIATATTVMIVFFLTRFLRLELSASLKLSGIAGVADVILKLSLYYAHERIWGLSGFGRKEHPLSSLPLERPLEEKDMKEVENKLKELGYMSED